MLGLPTGGTYTHVRDRLEFQVVDAKALQDAMWAGDIDLLNEVARCICCCDEHTFENCPARTWFGCRGQATTERADQETWARHYQKFHGMTEREFYG